MTISSTTRIAGPFIGNGTASVFGFAFKVFTASDLDVVRLTISSGIEYTLVLNADYTVSLNGDQNSNPGGSITLLAGPLASGFTLTITSDIPNLQPTDLTNQGGFYPEVITDALDRATIQIQQMTRDVGRSIKSPVADGTLDMELPNVTNRAGKYLVFDAGGLPTASVGTGNDTALRTDLADTSLALAGANLIGYRANYASSVGRTALSKLRDVVSVMDFGAVGDGVVDDTTAFTTAVSAAGTRNVFVPAGSYKITGTVTGDFYSDGTVTIVTGTVNAISRIGAIVSTSGDITAGGDIIVSGNDIRSSGGSSALTLSGSDVAVVGDLTVTGNDIKSSTATSITLSGADAAIAGDLTVNGNDIKSSGATVFTMSGANVAMAGDATLTNGNLVIGTIGKGVDFSATAHPAGMTSEVLSDYEEGTWTASIAFGGGSVGLLYSQRTGLYTKIGRLVTVSVQILLANKGTSTGSAVISGLPFTVQNANGASSAASLSTSAMTFADFPMAEVVPNTVSMSLYESTNAGVQTALTNADFSNTTQIVLACSYMAA